MRLEEPSAGEALFHGRDIFRADERELKDIRRRIQVIFQDPYASLNPRMRVEQIIASPGSSMTACCRGAEWPERVRELLESVGLRREHAERYPHEFSGGQRQRIGIARAMALNPEILICDEPVSALDVSVQAQVVNLLEEIQQRLGIAYIFIAHDLSVVRHMSHRVAVMYLGRIVEIGSREQVYSRRAIPIPKRYCRRSLRSTFGRAAPPADHSAGRGAEPGQSAVRLPLSQPLLENGGIVLRRSATARRRCRGRPQGCMLFPGKTCGAGLRPTVSTAGGDGHRTMAI